MNILSIDASTKSTGWSVFEGMELKEYACIQSSSNDLIKRIHIMVDALEEVLNKYNIDKVILEEVRPEAGLQNIKTHRALMWLQGAIVMMLHDKYPKVTVEYLYPSEWRSLCGIQTGRGIKRESLKPKDIKFVKDTYNITVNDDIADAIGIGHAYLQKNASAW